MVKISRSFIKGSILYTLIGALPMASAILLVPFYMAHLSTAVFGALSIYLAISLFVQLLVTYSYDTSLYVHYHEFKNDKPKLSSFISSAFVFMILVGTGLFVILAATGKLIVPLLFDDPKIQFFPNGWLAVAGGVFQAIFKVHSSLLQSREKQERYFWANLLLFSGIVVFTIAGLRLFPASLIGPLGGRALAFGLGTIWVLVMIMREFGIHFNPRMLRESFEFNLYLFIYQIQQWVINYFDRILMLFYLPLSTVGVYDFAVKSVMGVELLMNGLHSSFIPKVMSKLITGKEVKGSSIEVNRYYHGFIAFIMLAVSGCILFIPPLIEWLSNYLHRPEYKLSIALVPYIAILYLIRSVRLFFGLPYSILKYTKPLPVIYLVVALVKIGGVVLLASRMGAQGVVIASAASALLETWMLYFLSRNRFDFRFNIVKVLGAPVVLFAFIIISELSLQGVNEMIRHASYCILCGILLFMAYRTELKTIKLFDLIK